MCFIVHKIAFYAHRLVGLYTKLCFCVHRLFALYMKLRFVDIAVFAFINLKNTAGTVGINACGDGAVAPSEKQEAPSPLGKG